MLQYDWNICFEELHGARERKILCVYALEYLIVWCVKYRRKVITHDAEMVLFDPLHAYAKDNGFPIREANTDLDHVHLLIEAMPMVLIPDLMKGMKGVSARVLFQTFPELKEKLWGGHMWNPPYFVAAVSENTKSQIVRYLRGTVHCGFPASLPQRQEAYRRKP